MNTTPTEEMFLVHYEEEPTPPHRRRVKLRRRPKWIPLVADVAVAGVLLCLFALFHHVLPQTYAPVTPNVPDNEVTDTPSGSLSQMEQTFDKHFTFDPVKSDTSYKSKSITIDVTTHTMGSGANLITYYVADVYLRSVENFRTAFADDKFGRGLSEPLLDISKRSNALLAVSGDYYGLHNNGPVIRNGVLYRSRKSSADVCALYRDGTMKTFAGKSFDAEKELQNGAWQTWSFGPSLLNADGTAATSFNSTITGKNPRCAIGYYEPGHYAFVLVDGRRDGHSCGMTMRELAKLFESMGCAAAYNLDGGRTAQMAFDQEIVNRPYLDGRNVSDIVYIGEVE